MRWWCSYRFCPQGPPQSTMLRWYELRRGLNFHPNILPPVITWQHQQLPPKNLRRLNPQKKLVRFLFTIFQHLSFINDECFLSGLVWNRGSGGVFCHVQETKNCSKSGQKQWTLFRGAGCCASICYNVSLTSCEVDPAQNNESVRYFSQRVD